MLRKQSYPYQDDIAVEMENMSCRHSGTARDLIPLGRFEVHARVDMTTTNWVIFLGRVEHRLAAVDSFTAANAWRTLKVKGLEVNGS